MRLSRRRAVTTRQRAIARGLIDRVACSLAAAALGNFPVPLLGYGVAPILGYYLGVARCRLESRMNAAAILLLAVVDSINPSAIVVTLYLLSTMGRRVPGAVAVYVGAIFITYLSFGVTLVVGIARLVPSFGRALDTQAGLAVQFVVGLALLAYALAASPDRRSPDAPSVPSASTYAALAMLGVTVTAMELPTALPYFGAVALVSEAGLPARSWLPLLVAYNVIFVLPPLALLAGHLVLRDRLAASYGALRQRLEQGARETALWIAGLVGSALVLTSAIEIVARLG